MNRARLALVFLAFLVLNGGIAAAAMSLKPLPNEQAITKKALVAREISQYKNAIVHARAELRKIAGRSGMRAKRRELLGEIAFCSRQLGQLRSGRPLKFHYMDRGDVLPMRGIGFIKTVRIFQVMSKSEALVQVRCHPAARDRAYSTPPIGAPAAEMWMPDFVMMRGFDFSGSTNGQWWGVHGTVKGHGVVVYRTASGGSNTAVLLEPIKILDHKAAPPKPNAGGKK